MLENLAVVRRRGGPAIPVHLKVDTGTKRQGVSPEEALKLSRAAVSKGLEVVGLATHFANIEDTLEHEFARLQLRRFSQTLELLRDHDIDPKWIHAACSAAVLLFPETTFNLVRVGISLYGHWPSRETRLSWRLSHPDGRLELRPALRWLTLVGQIQTVLFEAKRLRSLAGCV